VPRYFLRLSYNGTAYAGWQVQPNATTVQQVLNEKLEILLKTSVETTGCGRTDTGVHASCFYVHFDVSDTVTDRNGFLNSMNAVLPHDMAVHEIIEVDDNAHARFDATLRTYRYFITTEKNPFLINRVLRIYQNVDLNTMKECCSLIKGKHDFSAFSKTGTQVKTNICTVSEATWESRNNLIVFTISADRFLRGMVRAVVGTMLEAGVGKVSPADFKNIINSGKRSEAGMAASPDGLYLSDVKYPYITPSNIIKFPF